MQSGGGSRRCLCPACAQDEATKQVKRRLQTWAEEKRMRIWSVIGRSGHPLRFSRRSTACWPLPRCMPRAAVGGAPPSADSIQPGTLRTLRTLLNLTPCNAPAAAAQRSSFGCCFTKLATKPVLSSPSSCRPSRSSLSASFFLGKLTATCSLPYPRVTFPPRLSSLSSPSARLLAKDFSPCCGIKTTSWTRSFEPFRRNPPSPPSPIRDLPLDFHITPRTPGLWQKKSHQEVTLLQEASWRADPHTWDRIPPLYHQQHLKAAPSRTRAPLPS